MSVIIDNLQYFAAGPFPNGPIGGFALTLILSLLAGAGSFLIGVTFFSITLVPLKLVRYFSVSVSVLIRGLPSLVFLFWIYFLLPVIIGIDISPIQAAVVGLSLYHGAFISEDIRGGIHAVNKGQWEAGRATGLRTTHLLRYILLPQAIRAVIPALINRYINIFLYTSVVSILGVLEFTRAAVHVNNREIVHPMEIFAFVGIVYYVFGYMISAIGAHLERKWNWAPKIGQTSMAL